MDPFGRCTLVLIVFNKVDELRNLMLFKERIVFRALVDAIARDKLVKLSFGACIQLRPGRLLNIIFHNTFFYNRDMCFLTLYVTPRIEYEVCLRHENSRSVYCVNKRKSMTIGGDVQDADPIKVFFSLRSLEQGNVKCILLETNLYNFQRFEYRKSFPEYVSKT